MPLRGFAELSCAVVSILLVLESSHRDKSKNNVSQNESDSEQCALTADEQHSRKEREQYSADEEGICQNLNVHSNAFCEKAFYPDYVKGDRGGYAEENGIFYQ